MILSPAEKKAYEISYAMFRVGAVLDSRSFADLLEKEALNIIYSVLNKEISLAKSSVHTTACLIALGRDAGVIHSENAELLLQEIATLESSLIDSLSTSFKEKKLDLNPANLSDIFTSLPKAEPMIRTSQSLQSPEAKDRQNMILEKIRQSGNCHSRDIQAILPDLSERTLRYDLQKLIEEGRIERGGAGPASWYRVKEVIQSMP